MDKDQPVTPWWHPHRHRDRRPLLLRRGQIKRAARHYFEDQGFTEVECGILATSPGNEAHLHAFRSDMLSTGGQSQPVYLHTSPEFAAKKLLAAGEEKIFDFARVFRNRERGPLHAPEFSMLEWYRAHEPYEAVMQDCLNLLRLAAPPSLGGKVRFNWAECDVLAEPEKLSLAEAFQRYAGIDLLATLNEKGEGDRDHLSRKAQRAGFDVAENDNWADIFSKVLVARIEPELGRTRPTLLLDYPRCEAALARAKPADPRLAERFELYICGVELANGFGELTDPAEQRQRFKAEMAEKQRIYGETYPLDEELLAALPLMPPASGVAMGFDRLVMLVTGAPRIEDVLWTPAPPALDAHRI